MPRYYCGVFPFCAVTVTAEYVSGDGWGPFSFAGCGEHAMLGGNTRTDGLSDVGGWVERSRGLPRFVWRGRRDIVYIYI